MEKNRCARKLARTSQLLKKYINELETRIKNKKQKKRDETEALDDMKKHILRYKSKNNTKDNDITSEEDISDNENDFE